MGVGGFIRIYDRTTCGGMVLEGVPNHQMGKEMLAVATNGCLVSCGKHPGRYRIVGGHPGYISFNGQPIASTIYSESSCPCKAKLISSISTSKAMHLSAQPKVARSVESEQNTQMAKAVTTSTSTASLLSEKDCVRKSNPLSKGVYIWTEIQGAGHSFISVHENNLISVYTYGRYGRTGPGDLTGDGILNFLQDEDAKTYYRFELYRMGARVFSINDANVNLIRQYFEDLWNNAKPAIQTQEMPDITRRRGRTIDKYDVTGSNCTTHTVAGIRVAGSALFKTSYVPITTQFPIEGEEEFTIPVSLQRYLVDKSKDLTSMLIVEVTNEFKKQYSNMESLRLYEPGLGAEIQGSVTGSSAMGDSLSVYSGGTIGGSLGSTNDIE
ncbi:MAG: PAAR domain-containing protein [Enterobacteriaceae bacterium]|jgi:uncharacterized Zn-binding protein involved in type VI secretion|nr:PAAR domain-containing protein [Enterobacteriaceae bacterium]